MKKTILFFLALGALTINGQQCFDYTQYGTTQLQVMIDTTPAGNTVVQQGDIALVRLDSTAMISGITSNEMIYYGFPGLGFDISTFSSPCKKITITGALFGLFVDGDSINNPLGGGAEFAVNGSNYIVHRDTSYNYTIEGDFNTFHFSSTNSIESLCLEACEPTTNCFDFTRYSATQLSQLVWTTPVDNTIVQQGDIALIRIDSSVTNIDIIDTINNGMGYFGFPGLAFDVSSFPSSCKKVSFGGSAYGLIVDNDSITTYPFANANFTATYDTTGLYTLEGDFDVFHFYSTNVINNLCIEACDSTTGIVNHKNVSISIYPNPVTDILTINTPYQEYTSLYIIGMDGRIVRQENSTNSIDVTDLANGVYELMLTNNSGSVNHVTFVKK